MNSFQFPIYFFVCLFVSLLSYYYNSENSSKKKIKNGKVKILLFSIASTLYAAAPHFNCFLSAAHISSTSTSIHSLKGIYLIRDSHFDD